MNDLPQLRSFSEAHGRPGTDTHLYVAYEENLRDFLGLKKREREDKNRYHFEVTFDNDKPRRMRELKHKIT